MVTSSLRSYPDGRQGVALLVLRIALAALGSIWGMARWTEAGPPAVTLVPLLAAGCLFVGLFTTWVALLCGAAVVVAGSDWERGAVAVVLALVVAVLGPGSYSADAVLYGRRRRVFPPGG